MEYYIYSVEYEAKGIRGPYGNAMKKYVLNTESLTKATEVFEKEYGGRLICVKRLERIDFIAWE